MSETKLPVSWLRNVVPINDRNSGIGGSDISAVLGKNKYRSPHDVWLEKTGKSKPSGENQFTKWGKILEPAIHNEYCIETGRIVVQPNQVLRSTDHEWMVGSPDGLCEEIPKIAEYKTASQYVASEWGDIGTDNVPDAYYCQCHWYMALTGAQSADLVPLIGGSDFRIYPLSVNPQLQDYLMTKAEAFWTTHILGDTPPEITASKNAEEWIRYRFRRNEAPMRVASCQEEELMLRLTNLNRQLEFAEDEKENLVIQLKAAIGDSEGLISDYVGKITWRNNKDSNKTNWQAIARALNAPTTIIAQHTETTPGARVFKFTPNTK